MPQVMNEALDEIERRAWYENDQRVLEVIYRAEDYAEDYVSPEHELVIDDRNQLRDALRTCVEEMDALSSLVQSLDEGEDVPIPDSFADAMNNGETSLRNSEEVPQIDDTLAEKLAKAQDENEKLHKDYSEMYAKMQPLRELLHVCEHLVNKAPATHRPKWVMTLANQLSRVRAAKAHLPY